MLKRKGCAMRVLFIGDIVGPGSVGAVEKILPTLRRDENIGFVIANGENAAENNGITPDIAERLRYCGVDVITTGNHAFRQKSSYGLFDDGGYIVRPANFPPEDPGMGYLKTDTPDGKVAVVNLSGKLYCDADENPFFTADRLLPSLSDCDFVFVDFHAEATSEKKALGFYLDGKVTAVFGTHTHVQTSDCRILPKGTGYITDVGMVGGKDSVLGIKAADAIKKFTTKTPVRYNQDTEKILFQSVFFDTETKEIKTVNIQTGE